MHGDLMDFVLVPLACLQTTNAVSAAIIQLRPSPHSRALPNHRELTLHGTLRAC